MAGKKINLTDQLKKYFGFDTFKGNRFRTSLRYQRRRCCQAHSIFNVNNNSLLEDAQFCSSDYVFPNAYCVTTSRVLSSTIMVNPVGFLAPAS